MYCTVVWGGTISFRNLPAFGWDFALTKKFSVILSLSLSSLNFLYLLSFSLSLSHSLSLSLSLIHIVPKTRKCEIFCLDISEEGEPPSSSFFLLLHLERTSQLFQKAFDGSPWVIERKKVCLSPVRRAYAYLSAWGRVFSRLNFVFYGFHVFSVPFWCQKAPSERVCSTWFLKQVNTRVLDSLLLDWS